MAENHSRIDEGIPRPIKRQMRRDAIKRPRSAKGQYLHLIEPAKRAEIILEAPERILRGESTTRIAESYGVSASTIRSWLIGNEKAEAARGAMLAMELSLQLEAIETATDPLSLARAREAFRAWSWIAERREARLYGQKQEVNVTGTVQVSHALQAISERRQGQITANDAPQLPQSVIDVEAERVDNDDTHQ